MRVCRLFLRARQDPVDVIDASVLEKDRNWFKMMRLKDLDWFTLTEIARRVVWPIVQVLITAEAGDGGHGWRDGCLTVAAVPPCKELQYY